jgi:excinuclease ABC subunit B
MNVTLDALSASLATTLTKKMAEDLTTYLKDKKIKAEYLHSDIKTIDRIEILTEFRKGTFDCLVGVNLLREGLDLPEVSLVAILDADKEGFLRSEKSLIQTIGRAARNVDGQVIMYADNITKSMRKALDETNRRRERQVAHNLANGIDPTPLRKKISDINDSIIKEDSDTELVLEEAMSIKKLRKDKKDGASPAQDLANLITELSAQMKLAASELSFELAARYRDEIHELKKELRQMVAAGHA